MAENGRFTCFLIGSESLLVECAEILIERGHQVRGVMTDTPRLAAWATERGIPSHPVAGGYRETLAAAPFDYLFSITHLAVIPDDILALPRRGAINFHDGPLPRFAGLHTPAWGLIRSEPEWAITFHALTGQVDRGDILAQTTFPIAPDDTSFTLNAKCFEAGIQTFTRLVEELVSGTIRPVSQDHAAFEYFGRHKRPEGACVLDFSRPAVELAALVRALDFGRYPNPLGSAKLLHRGQVRIVTRAQAWNDRHDGAPGEILAADDHAIRVATSAGELVINGLAETSGRATPLGDVVHQWSLTRGVRLDLPHPAHARRLTEMGESLSRAERYWLRRLQEFTTPDIPGLPSHRSAGSAPGQHHATITVPTVFAERHGSHLDAALTALVGAFLARVGNAAFVDVEYQDADLRHRIAGIEPLLSTHTPLRIAPAPDATFEQLLHDVEREIQKSHERGPYLRDLIARNPPSLAPSDSRAHTSVTTPHHIAIEISPSGVSDVPEHALTIRIFGPTIQLDAPGWGAGLDELASQLAAFLYSIAHDPRSPLDRHDLLSPELRHKVLVEWNGTAKALSGPRTITSQLDEQAARSPDAIALVCAGEEMTYARLHAEANRVAHLLRHLGIGPESRVGVCIERSIDMVVALLGIIKSGGAYVPLDPAFPIERIRFMAADAGLSAVLTQQHLLTKLPSTGARVVCMDADRDTIQRHSAAAPPTPSVTTPAHAAYVIYTSGSSGKPKGVVVEHRNVVNFFAGMDDRIPRDVDGRPGVWLAVTSLSFDISVLELLWTLSRGLKVVLYADAHKARPAPASPRADPNEIQFSLFYFAASEEAPDQSRADRYKLLLDGARFADTHGFAAVWTPERHFHAFGGLYPNPAVTSAALATITERIQIRAGSVVLPLHHPARVAEEWALVDNLSRGRVGIAFASGWQPVDFILRPEAYANRQKALYDAIDTVRRLWRGESVEFPDHTGAMTPVRTLPRPIQPELPTWVTTAGSIDTWKSAARIGANILTHLLGQTVEELGEKIRIYREEFAKANPARPTGTVTIMLHAFVGDDADAVRETVREPMIAYLGTSLSLVKNVASSWAAFKKRSDGTTQGTDLDLKTLSPEEMRDLLAFSFERYYETSGLFGAHDRCVDMVRRLHAAGVNEIACLIDFGVETGLTLRHLEHLDAVRRDCAATPGTPIRITAPVQSIGDLIRAHAVTHLQCTPSMARMILMDDRERDSLASLKCLAVGGEALPGALAAELASATGARLLNMYGPTETTVWSSTHEAGSASGAAIVPIGRPIANTQLYVLDPAGRPVPPGVIGELFIGGEGVARGYLNRPELTAERFVPDSFGAAPDARLYGTGDLARWSRDGVMEFVGRADHQVKLRGYRIELGEIEAAIAATPGIRDAAVTLREDAPGDPRLVAYAVRQNGSRVDADQIKANVRGSLPEYMVPARIEFLDALPLTPNRKVDRKALPAPRNPAPDTGPERPSHVAASAAPAADEIETTILAIWRDALGLPRAGVDQNFFDLGGHSLLAVKVHRTLKEKLRFTFAITDLFRFPTVRALAAHVRGVSAAAPEADPDAGEARAEKRRAMMSRRRGAGDDNAVGGA